MKRNDQTTFSSPVRAITPCRPLIFRQHDTDSIPTTQRRLHAGRCSRETGTLAKQTGMMLSSEIERLRHIHRETSNPYTEKRVTLLEILIEDALAARLEEKEMELEALKEDAFYTTTDFKDPYPLERVLEAYDKRGEKTFIGYKHAVTELEELSVISLPPSSTPTSSPAASTSHTAVPTSTPAASTSYSTGPAAYTLDSIRFIAAVPTSSPAASTSDLRRFAAAFSTGTPHSNGTLNPTTTLSNIAKTDFSKRSRRNLLMQRNSFFVLANDITRLVSLDLGLDCELAANRVVVKGLVQNKPRQIGVDPFQILLL
jgi:hypothetical protein